MKKLLFAAMLVLVLIACSLSTAYAKSRPPIAPYQVPPMFPPAATPEIAGYLDGSWVTAEGGWIVAHLEGTPYEVGFQNGYLTAQSAAYTIENLYGPPGQVRRSYVDRISQDFIWPLVPAEYRHELRGVADGIQAAGYTQVKLWDVVGLNAQWDGPAYLAILPPAAPMSIARDIVTQAEGLGRCSAFIATGKATADGRPVMGHESWSPYGLIFTANVMFTVEPEAGHDFTYQSFGGCIWSGMDWYENSAGLLLTETTLADTTYTLEGVPVFVRARKAAQYATTVSQAVDILVGGNNGAYSNEWLIGDAGNRIASLQLGGETYDLNTTRSGFFGSCNFAWGPNVRAEQLAAGYEPQPYDPATICYARYIRWQQLEEQHWGDIDAAIGMTMISDTYDSYLGTESPGIRCLCGEPEFYVPDLSEDEQGAWYVPHGSFDGKVCTETMALNGLRSWACWGRGSGHHFDADAFLEANPWWPSEWSAMALFGLKTFSEQSTDTWVLLGD